MTPQERAALALWLLMQAPHTTQALAKRLEMTPSGTRRMLATISRVTPIYCYKGLWQVNGQGTV